MNLSKQQRSFVNSDEPYSAFIGGRQSGKSTAIGRSLLEVIDFAGHKIIDINGQIKCVVCGESTTYNEENAFDRVASYGLFQGCDCE